MLGFLGLVMLWVEGAGAIEELVSELVQVLLQLRGSQTR